MLEIGNIYNTKTGLNDLNSFIFIQKAGVSQHSQKFHNLILSFVYLGSHQVKKINRQTDKHKQTGRETNRQKDRQIESFTDRQRYRQTGKQMNRQSDKAIYSQIYKQKINRYKYRHIDRQRDRKEDRQRER